MCLRPALNTGHRDLEFAAGTMGALRIPGRGGGGRWQPSRSHNRHRRQCRCPSPQLQHFIRAKPNLRSPRSAMRRKKPTSLGCACHSNAHPLIGIPCGSGSPAHHPEIARGRCVVAMASGSNPGRLLSGGYPSLPQIAKAHRYLPHYQMRLRIPLACLSLSGISARSRARAPFAPPDPTPHAHPPSTRLSISTPMLAGLGPCRVLQYMHCPKSPALSLFVH